MNYEPKPARVKVSHPDQRRFLPSEELAQCYSLPCALPDSYGTGVDLYRHAEKDTVRLTLKIGIGLGEVGLPFNAIQLQELARMCLDAAHDLDAYPAAVLMEGQPS